MRGGGQIRGLRGVALLAAALAAGCNHSLVNDARDAGLLARTTNENGAGYTVLPRPLVPNASLQLTPSYALTLEKLLYGAAVYYFVDPLSPNWQGEMRRLTEDTFSISLRSKRFRSVGGDGESGRVFRRNAEQIVREGGFAGYTIVSFAEGIESETLGAVRYSEGVIRVARP